MKTFYGAVLVFMALPVFANAHPGNTDSKGCHQCRTHCDKWNVPWDIKHCHGDKVEEDSSPHIKKFSQDHGEPIVKNNPLADESVHKVSVPRERDR